MFYLVLKKCLFLPLYVYATVNYVQSARALVKLSDLAIICLVNSNEKRRNINTLEHLKELAFANFYEKFMSINTSI